MSVSSRNISYLHTLPQFMAPITQEACVDLRTGVRVSEPKDARAAERGFLQVSYPDGRTFLLPGAQFTEIHLVEACRHWFDLGKVDDL